MGHTVVGLAGRTSQNKCGFLGRKVRAVSAGWRSSGFFDFAQNDDKGKGKGNGKGNGGIRRFWLRQNDDNGKGNCNCNGKGNGKGGIRGSLRCAGTMRPFLLRSR